MLTGKKQQHWYLLVVDESQSAASSNSLHAIMWLFMLFFVNLVNENCKAWLPRQYPVDNSGDVFTQEAFHTATEVWMFTTASGKIKDKLEGNTAQW